MNQSAHFNECTTILLYAHKQMFLERIEKKKKQTLLLVCSSQVQMYHVFKSSNCDALDHNFVIWKKLSPYNHILHYSKFWNLICMGREHEEKLS